MPHADLAAASEHCKAMRELVILRSGGAQDDHSLRHLQALAAAANASVDDPECRQLASAIASCATDLFSQTGHQKWARGKTSGPDFLRLQILRDLQAFEDRLNAVEATRMAAERQALATGAGTRPR